MKGIRWQTLLFGLYMIVVINQLKGDTTRLGMITSPLDLIGPLLSLFLGHPFGTFFGTSTFPLN